MAGDDDRVTDWVKINIVTVIRPMLLAHAIVVCIMFFKCGLTRFFSNSKIPDENMFDELVLLIDPVYVCLCY